MCSRNSLQTQLFTLAAFCLAAVGLLLVPAQRLHAQSIEVPADQAKSAPASALDEAAFLWQNESAPFVQKPDTLVNLPEDAKETRQFAHTLYLPGMRHESDAADAAATTPSWRLVHQQTFEGSFPTSGWTVADYNGSQVGGTRVWDDTPGGYNSYWAAHPNDSNTYANHTDTWMRYGPFNLIGAKDARFTFYYWLDTEPYYDFFSWELTCGDLQQFRLGETRSGQRLAWNFVTASLAKCLGYTDIYIRFSFKSDYSGTDSGVWVDNIRIEKYQ